MPILINEVIAEFDAGSTEPAPSNRDINTVPITAAEQELLQTIRLLQLRQDRLMID
jgi:hypothetical protein